MYCYDGFPCPAEYDCVYWGNPDWGVTSFDTILNSILNIFFFITTEGWTGEMYKIRHATGTYAYDALFHFTVIIGAYFILNLMIAVQYSYLA